MNEFQHYPFAEKLVDCWRNNDSFLIGEDFSIDQINAFQRTNINNQKNLWNVYVSTLLHFSTTQKDQGVQNLNIPAEGVYLRKELRSPPKLKEHQTRKYERIRLERQLCKWIFDIKYQQTLVDIINICVRYPDVSQICIQATNLKFTNGKIHLEGRVNLNRLKELAESMLETTKSNPPVIRRSRNHNDTKILKRIEEITDEIKKTKRMTFKSTEEIKNLLGETKELNVSDTNILEERKKYINTIIEVYDVFFHLWRVLKSNKKSENDKLFEEITNQLQTVEKILSNVGLEAIKCYGEMFDSSLMESVGTVRSEETNSLIQFSVADELIRGFIDKTQDKVIREAKVITVLN